MLNLRWRFGSVLILGLSAGLLLAVGCKSDSTGPAMGTLEVTASTTGSDVDSDGYMVTITGGSSQSISVNGTVAFSELSEGSYSVELGGLAVNCTVVGDNPRSASVEPGETVTVTFNVLCEALVGDLDVTTSTSGSDLDADGYTVQVDGGSGQSIGVNGTVLFSGLSVGDHSVELTDLAANCSVSGSNPASVNVSFGATATLTFDITCTPLTGDLNVNTLTTGTDIDPDGYTVAVDGGAGQAIGVNGTVTFSDLSLGDHSVQLSGVANNCSVSGTNPRMVTVTSGSTASTTFDVTCSSTTGNLSVTSSTTGMDLDPDGYTVTVDGTQSQAIGVNETISFVDLAVGDHTVELTDVAANCSVSGNNPRTVSVPSGSTVSTTFDVSCSATTGDLDVTSQTTGADLDPDGYTVTVDGSQSQAIAINETITFAGLATGDHTVELTGVAANCTVQGNNPRTVTVSGGSGATTFDVACTANNGNLEAITSSTGDDIDPDGYTVTVDGSLNQAVAANGSVTFNNLAVGDHTVELTDVAANCTVSGNNPRTVTVQFNTTVQTTFDVSCEPLTGDLDVTTNTTGSNLDPNGYTVTVDGIDSQSIGVNDMVTFLDVATGDHDVELSDLSDNCYVVGENPRTVTVQGGSGQTTFDVTCYAPLQSKIVFESNRDGNFEIYVMNADGTGKVRLTNDAASDVHPVVSPDGLKIAFTSDRDGGNDIWVMNADGSQPVNLTNGAGSNNYKPEWSPDGTQIAFVRRTGGQNDVWVMNANGSSPTNLTSGSAADDEDPAWSPDGTQIAFQSDSDGDFEIYRMNSFDGSSVVQLTTDPGTDFAPDWSPDGNQIVFAADRGVPGEIYVMSATDGSGETNLSNNAASDFMPAWSPSGAQIVFTSTRDGNSEIYVMDADGSNQTRLTINAATDDNGDWSP